MDAGGGGGGLIVILGIDSGGGTVTDDFEWRGIDSAQHDIIIKCWFLKQFFFFIYELFTTSAFKCFLKNCEKIISLWLMILIVWMEKRKEKYYEVVMVKKDARLSGKFD